MVLTKFETDTIAHIEYKYFIILIRKCNNCLIDNHTSFSKTCYILQILDLSRHEQHLTLDDMEFEDQDLQIFHFLTLTNLIRKLDTILEKYPDNEKYRTLIEENIIARYIDGTKLTLRIQ